MDTPRADIPRLLRLALKRTKPRLTHEAVALKCKVNRSAVTQWLTDKTTPTLENLESFARACGLSLAELFALEVDEEEEEVTSAAAV